jgi:antitoxin VapB
MKARENAYEVKRLAPKEALANRDRLVELLEGRALVGRCGCELRAGLQHSLVRPMYIPVGYTEVTMVVRSKVFKTNRSQAVRIPKAVAFPDGVEEVEIIRVGANLVVSPIGKRWDDLFERGPKVSDDFLTERMTLEFPEREDL